MRNRFRKPVKRAYDYVQKKPREYYPASPVVPQEQEDARDDSDCPNGGDKDDPTIERPFRKVIDEAN
jgi:hypothetical protein